MKRQVESFLDEQGKDWSFFDGGIRGRVGRVEPTPETPADRGGERIGRLEGESVLEYSNRRQLPVEERMELFRDVCAAVAHAHRNLVVHQDIKPGNILVTADGTVKLDFGIAKLLAPDEGPGAQRTAILFRALTPD